MRAISAFSDRLVDEIRRQAQLSSAEGANGHAWRKQCFGVAR